MKRYSYASIERKSHPKTITEIFDFEEPTKKTGVDNDIISKILNLFSHKIRDLRNDGTGEWEWLQNNKQKNFIKSICDMNMEEISHLLVNMFKTEATYGYLSPSFQDCKDKLNAVKSDILCNIDTCFEFSDIKNIHDLATEYGNPYGLKVNEKIILPDTPRHYYYSYNIERLLKSKLSNPLIIEIGGGFGGLCLQNFRRFKSNCTIVNIDLFPALITTFYYLTKNRIPVNIIDKNNSKIQNKTINLISSKDISILRSLIKKCDLIFNSRSLCEMNYNTLKNYFDFINNCDCNFLYHENSNFLLFPKSQRHVELMADNFPVDHQRYRLLAKYLTPFTGGDGRYREYIYESCKN